MFKPLCLVLVTAVLAGPPALAGDSPRTVSVTGNASVMAPPDRASVSMAVQARDPDLAAARSRVSSVSGRFLQLCAELGIPKADIQTTALTLQPEYRWDPEGREQVLLGYLVQRQLEVSLNDLDLLGPLLERAADAGVNQVSPPVLDSSRRAELHREALAAAARDARAKAEVLATTLGARIGRPHDITSVEGFRPQPMAMRAQAMEAGDAAATYQAGDLRIEAQVNAVFELTD